MLIWHSLHCIRGREYEYEEIKKDSLSYGVKQWQMGNTKYTTN